MSRWHQQNQGFWGRRRREVLDNEPLCRLCKSEGMTVAASHVDHIKPIHEGGGHGLDNLQPLCATCHYHKSRLEWMKGKRIGHDGWPVEIDTNQHWIRQARPELVRPTARDKAGGGQK